MKTTPYMSISDACEATGISQYFLRNGCKNGSVPHIKSGKKYLINVPKLLSQLNNENSNGGNDEISQ